MVPQNVILEVKLNEENLQENNLIEISYNNFTLLSCRALASIEDIYLTGASVKLIIDTYEIDMLESPNYWYNKTFTISTDIFSLGINYVYLKFELANYTTTIFSFQIQVRQIATCCNARILYTQNTCSARLLRTPAQRSRTALFYLSTVRWQHPASLLELVQALRSLACV